MTLTPDDPRHGEYAGYVAGCRCDDCRLARFRYSKRVNLRRLRGPLQVPIDRARAHIDRCVKLGMTYQAFEDAGVRSVGRIHDGSRKFIHAGTERRILAVQPTPGVNWFPTEGARRRLRALIALGHPQVDLSERLGVPQPHTSDLVTGNRGIAISPETWKRIEAVYEALCMTPGGSEKSKKRAFRNGWAVPLAWDDIDTDEHPYSDLKADRHKRRDEVEEETVLRVLAGEFKLHTSIAEKREIMRRWLDSGRSERSLCEVTGWRDSRYTPDAKQRAS